MNIAVIVPFPGKQKYQAEYDAIIKAIEQHGDTVLSPEKSRAYHQGLAREAKLRDTPKAHYEFIRKSIIDSDAVIVEVSWEDFQVGHETTLALLYRKPVLALSQSTEHGKYVHHPDFYGVKYTPPELPALITTFLEKVRKQHAGNNQAAVAFNPKRKTVAVFGGVYADIFNSVARIPHENEVELSDNFKISLGGKATNAAVALARLGDEIFICGRIGHDTMGSDLEAILIHEGIKTDFLQQDRQAITGTVTLAVDKRAKYSTIVHEAANVRITRQDVDRLFREVDAGRLRLDCVYVTLEPQKDMVDYIVREAAKRRLFVFCDAAPHIRPLDTELLPFINIVAPNQLEAQAITGLAVANRSSAAQAGDRLRQAGAKQVIITIGDKGAYYQDQQGSTFIKALRVPAIDEAAAGDAFRASFVHALIHKRPLATALEQASRAGAYAVTRFGSYDSMPTVAELKAFERQLYTPHSGAQ
jgi:ribokinase